MVNLANQRTPVAKAGMFSGSQSHQGKSQSPVTWVASVEETMRMKPTDKAICRMGSESPASVEDLDGNESGMALPDVGFV